MSRSTLPPPFSVAELQHRVRRASLAPPDASPDESAAYGARVRAYWTAERKASAVPPPGWIGPRDPELGELAVVPAPARVPRAILSKRPFSSIGKLYVQFEDGGQNHRATACAVGPNLIMTAAHCVVDKRGTPSPRPALHVLFDPQYDAAASPGTFAGVDIYYLDEYATVVDGAPYDFAFVRVEPLPAAVPPLALNFWEPAIGTALSLGYPFYKNGKFEFDHGERMWQSESQYKRRAIKQDSFLRAPNLFTGGASGGPWIDTAHGRVVSLNARGGDGVVEGPLLGGAAYVLWQAVTGLAMNWSQNTDCGKYPTSVLYCGTPNAVVAGVVGYVYGYQAESSSRVLNNALTGYGKHEARLASDGASLYVGINGYVLALAYNNFHRVQKLESMQVGGPTTVLWDPRGQLYAGATAQVCRIARGASEDVVSYNALDDVAGGDVNLAFDETNLYAGTGGQLTAIALADFESAARLWTTPITNASSDVVGVMCAHGRLYAGAGGIVCQVDPSTGAMTSRSLELGPITSGEVRFAAGPHTLYVGCGGTVVAFDGCATPCSIASGPLWKTALGSGGVVSVLHIGDFVYAGCNGMIYQLSAQTGALIDTIALTGGAAGEVRLASAEDGALLFAGCCGYAYSFVLAAGERPR